MPTEKTKNPAPGAGERGRGAGEIDGLVGAVSMDKTMGASGTQSRTFADALTFLNDGGVLVPLSRVRRVVCDDTDKLSPQVLLILDDKSRFEVSATEWEVALAKTVQVAVPAAPGTYILYTGDTPDEVTKVPVLGWAICADTLLRPITAEWNVGDDGDRTVLHPSGIVDDLRQGLSYPSLEEWQRQQQRVAQLNRREVRS